MSENIEEEEKWTLHFRDDQCQLISDAMSYIISRASERIDGAKYQPFDQFTAATTKRMAQEIMQQIADVTS